MQIIFQIHNDSCVKLLSIWNDCLLISKNHGHLGKVWHDGFFISKDERCHAAQMNMVAQCCLCMEGQHMTPGVNKKKTVHLNNGTNYPGLLYTVNNTK